MAGFLAGLLVEDGGLDVVLENGLFDVLDDSTFLKVAVVLTGAFKLISFSIAVSLLYGSSSTESAGAV